MTVDRSRWKATEEIGGGDFECACMTVYWGGTSLRSAVTMAAISAVGDKIYPSRRLNSVASKDQVTESKFQWRIRLNLHIRARLRRLGDKHFSIAPAPTKESGEWVEIT